MDSGSTAAATTLWRHPSAPMTLLSGVGWPPPLTCLLCLQPRLQEHAAARLLRSTRISAIETLCSTSAAASSRCALASPGTSRGGRHLAPLLRPHRNPRQESQSTLHSACIFESSQRDRQKFTPPQSCRDAIRRVLEIAARPGSDGWRPGISFPPAPAVPKRFQMPLRRP